LEVNGNIITSPNNVFPYIALDSSGAGDNWTSQGAHISLGESGNLGAAALHLTYIGNGTSYIGSGVPASGVPAASYLRFSYNTKYIYTDSNIQNDATGNSYFMGNIGIGNTVPSYKLDVTGDTRSTGNIIANDKFISSRYGYAGTYSSTQVQGIWSIGDAYQIDTAADTFGTLYGMGYSYNKNGGAPFASEHQIVFTNNGSIKAAIGLTNGSGYFAGNVGIGTTAPGAKLEVVGSSTGNILIGELGGSATYGAIGLANSISATGYNFASGPADTTLYINRPTDKAIQFRENNSNSIQMIIAAGGNVGIGATVPGALLEVNGTTWLRGGTAPTSGLYVNNLGNVGIGTTSPRQLLDVNGVIAAGNTTDGVAMRLNGTDGEILGINTSFTVYNNLSLRTTSATQLYLKTDGNVGIGTTAPGALLEVRKDQAAMTQLILNNANTTSASTRFSMYRGATEMANLWVSGTDNDLNISNRTVNNDADIKFNLSDGSYGVTFKGSGNVGIGTATPGALLEVNGTTWLRGGTSPTSGLYVSNLGNVGIGTTAPGAKFEVADTYSVLIGGSGLDTGANVYANTTLYVGTKTANSLNLETNDVTRLNVDSAGNFNFNAGQLYVQKSTGNV
ncbi:MAG: hypothetical protein Q7T74_01805, partial [Candidatus Saccharibacteria bacterium]|nr:hypothetical protein [Candidatus Saccharibacteria bacterium]